MASNELYRELALSFPDTLESPHFERKSFRVSKKIFTTLSEKDCIANFKLSPIDQSSFCSSGNPAIYPVANKWGSQGWTSVSLPDIQQDLLEEILTAAYCETAPKKLVENYLTSKRAMNGKNN